MLTFLHLSDIHFRRDAGTPYDAFKDLRSEFERDALAFSKKRLNGPIDGILVSGDVAFSGAIPEYEIAHQWLTKVGTLLGLRGTEDIRVIPGNHDVDRDVVAKSPTIEDYHKNLRSAQPSLDEALARYLERDKEARKAIFRPIQNYVDFAAKFQCDISADRPYWESPYILDDGSTLIVRGINSTLVSDSLDSDTGHKLVVGSHQLEVTRQDGVEYLVMCHHPPSWLIDQDEAEDLLNSRVRIQIVGHKHRQRLVGIEDCVRITAGAMHPDKREPNWVPRYNYIQMEIPQQVDRIMRVTVFPRVYNSAGGTEFGGEMQPSGNDFKIYELSLPPWSRPPGAPRGEMPLAAGGNPTMGEKGLSMQPGRRLTYRFLALPHHERLRIAQELGLIDEQDQGLRDAELYKRYFERAASTKKLQELWQLVNAALKIVGEENPFLAKKEER